MKTKTSYMIVQDSDLFKFVLNINKQLKDGWVLHGNTTVVANEHAIDPLVYVQPLTKTDFVS